MRCIYSQIDCRLSLFFVNHVPYDGCIFVLRQLLQHETSKGFVAVEATVVSSNFQSRRHRGRVSQ